MANTANVLEKWRYCHLKGRATVSKLGNIVLFFLHDPKVNPQKDVLKFKDIEGSTEHSAVFKSTPQIDWSKGSTQTEDFEKVIAAFDEPWFKFTITNGFIFKKEDGSPVQVFADLEEPEEEDMEAMNPIVP